MGGDVDLKMGSHGGGRFVKRENGSREKCGRWSNGEEEAYLWGKETEKRKEFGRMATMIYFINFSTLPVTHYYSYLKFLLSFIHHAVMILNHYERSRE